MKPGVGQEMRNYELVRAIHEELTAGDGKGSFSNPYLNTVITITKMIERERPEMKEVRDVQPGWFGPLPEIKENSDLEETRFE
jgi:hypothetical protein